MAKNKILFRPGWKFDYSELGTRLGAQLGEKLGKIAGIGTKAAVSMIPFAGSALNTIFGNTAPNIGAKIGKGSGRLLGHIIDSIAQSPLILMDTLLPSIRGKKSYEHYQWEPEKQSIVDQTQYYTNPNQKYYLQNQNDQKYYEEY